MKKNNQTKPAHNKVEPRSHATGTLRHVRHLPFLRLTVFVLFVACALPVLAQSEASATPELVSIVGSVTGVNDETLSGAAVTITESVTGAAQSATTGDSGSFQLEVEPRHTYYVSISAPDFESWKSPAVVVDPGEHKILIGCRLRHGQRANTVTVPHDAETLTVEQVKVEEKQRVLGIVPKLYVVYDKNPDPLTTKSKFRLALKSATDPVSFVGIGILSGVQQAADTPDYQLGAKGYGQRFGANAADRSTSIMFGRAILPSLLHQDPRYFYQGTGTGKSRALHAIVYPFVCKGDNGGLQPNYSSMGGDLFSSAISNAYYPTSNRGVGLVFGKFAFSTAERIVSALAQEFVVPKLTARSKKRE